MCDVGEVACWMCMRAGALSWLAWARPSPRSPLAQVAPNRNIVTRFTSRPQAALLAVSVGAYTIAPSLCSKSPQVTYRASLFLALDFVSVHCALSSRASTLGVDLWLLLLQWTIWAIAALEFQLIEERCLAQCEVLDLSMLLETYCRCCMCISLIVLWMFLFFFFGQELGG
jgi:hypothetical protein